MRHNEGLCFGHERPKALRYYSGPSFSTEPSRGAEPGCAKGVIHIASRPEIKILQRDGFFLDVRLVHFTSTVTCRCDVRLYSVSTIVYRSNVLSPIDDEKIFPKIFSSSIGDKTSHRQPIVLTE